MPASWYDFFQAVFGDDGLTVRWAQPLPTITGQDVTLSEEEVVRQVLLFLRQVTALAADGIITTWPPYLGQFVTGPPPVIDRPVLEILNRFTSSIAAHAAYVSAHTAAAAQESARTAAAAQETGRTAEGSAKAKSAATAAPKAKAPAAPPVSLEGGHANFQQAVRDVQSSPAPVCTAVGRMYCTKFAVKECNFPGCRYAHACLHCNGQHALRLCPSRDGPGARA